MNIEKKVFDQTFCDNNLNFHPFKENIFFPHFIFHTFETTISVDFLTSIQTHYIYNCMNMHTCLMARFILLFTNKPKYTSTSSLSHANISFFTFYVCFQPISKICLEFWLQCYNILHYLHSNSGVKLSIKQTNRAKMLI